LEKYGPTLSVGKVVAEPEDDKTSPLADADAFGDLLPFGDPYWYQGWSR